MSRKIIVASAAGKKAQTFESSATTWGELKAQIGSLYNSGLEAIVSTTKATLSRDEAVLPEGDFNVFLVPTKNKAGAATLTDSLVEAIEEAVGDADIDDEDVDAVLGVVAATIKAFFTGAAVSVDAGSSAEAKAIAEAAKFL